MNTFSNAVINQSVRTENGMKAKNSTGSALVEFFFKAGAMRGKDITPLFSSAHLEDRELALRLALWLRDVREGAGERELFRQILNWLEIHVPQDAKLLLYKTPEIGRWDDIFSFNTKQLKDEAFGMLECALIYGNGLAAKWTPRKGALAHEIRKFLGLTPKAYRKLLVELTNVVEQKMCSNDWDNIDYSKVPSLASIRYRKAFDRHSPRYKEYTDKLASKDPSVKVNAQAVYPYDVLKSLVNINYSPNLSKAEEDFITAQWDNLPNYVGDSNILPMVDVSGSMFWRIGKNLTAMNVAISLGLYCAGKNTGAFKDLVLTFSERTDLVHLNGSIIERCAKLKRSHWGYNTNLHAALEKILNVAIEGEVSDEDMPKVLLILSDMQFDECVQFDDTALDMITRKYKTYKYTVPKVVFWNLAARDNVPASFNTLNVALVSGFSPSILKAVLKGDPEKSFDPYTIMLETIMVPRYNLD